MARRYTPEDLLHLRQSPLCVKPKDLPPLEEWMGQAVDEKAKRQSTGRTVRDTQTQSNGLTSKAPMSLDFSRQHGRQSSNGDLALKSGLFSPSIRDSSKTFETSRMGLGPLSPRGEQPSGMGRFGAGEREQGAARDRTTTRFSALRASKDEGESWTTSTRPNRKQEGEDTDRTFARRGDREHETARDSGRESHRRYGSEIATENIRNRDWRNNDKSGARLTNREWTNGQEQDPEWMAEEKPAAEDKKRTVEDFEAWKKSMRAQEAASKGNPISAAEQSVLPAAKKAIETPLALETGEDKFFGLWGAPAATPISESAGTTSLQPVAPAKGGKSKFTNFFSAPEPAPQIQQPILPPIERHAPTPPQSGFGDKLSFQNGPKTEDEQGFQRILDMLKAKSPAAPHINAAFKAPPRQRTPPPEATSTSATPPLVSPRPKSHGVQNFLNPQSPGTNPDSQFLLNLMRAKDPEPQQNIQFPQYGGPLGQQANQGQPPPYRQQANRSPEQRFPIDFPPGFDKLNHSAHQLNQRRHARLDSRTFEDGVSPHQQSHGPPPGFPGFLPGLNAPNFPPGLGPMPGQPGGFSNARGPRGGPPPGFGPGGPGPAPAQFHGGMNYPPGFAGLPNLAGMHLGDDHGPGPGAPPGFGGPQSGMGRPPPGFPGRGGPLGGPLAEMYDSRRGEQGIYGSRD